MNTLRRASITIIITCKSLRPARPCLPRRTARTPSLSLTSIWCTLIRHIRMPCSPTSRTCSINLRRRNPPPTPIYSRTSIIWADHLLLTWGRSSTCSRVKPTTTRERPQITQLTITQTVWMAIFKAVARAFFSCWMPGRWQRRPSIKRAVVVSVWLAMLLRIRYSERLIISKSQVLRRLSLWIIYEESKAVGRACHCY